LPTEVWNSYGDMTCVSSSLFTYLPLNRTTHPKMLLTVQVPCEESM